MEKKIAFSSKIDIQEYRYFSFTLSAIDRQNYDIEVSVNYGLSHDEPNTIVADVWAGIADDMFRRYLYTAHISQTEQALDDYAGIAMKIHNSHTFHKELKTFLEWAYKNQRK